MRFVLYNIRYATGTGWDYHIPFPFWGSFRKTEKNFEDISDFLIKLNPDIVGLVESDGGTYRQNGKSQPVEMASKIGGTPIFGCKYHPKSFITKAPVLKLQGNAVVSKIPPIKSNIKYLSFGVKRAMLEVEYDDFVLYLVHLSLGRKARAKQLEELSRKCLSADKPVILAGDCNTFGGEEELEPLIRKVGLKNANADCMPTYPSSSPRMLLDFVLHSPKIKVTDLLIPRVTFSDHLPLVCDFAL